MINSVNNNSVVSSDYDPYNISREGFLKIYLKMLELQDPTEPLNVKDMIEQNYQLQQIAFLTDLQKSMKTLIQSQQMGYITQVSSLIGKDIVVSTDRITDPSMPYVLLSSENLNGVTITIRNADNGQVVQQFQTDLREGINRLNLNGLTPGQYLVEVSKDGQPVRVILGLQLRVNYISFAGNNPLLGTDHGEQPLENVVYISS